MEPKVNEIILNKEYPFMYDNFIVSTHSEVFLFLQAKADQISILKFSIVLQQKNGYPNDEVGHPLSKYGLGFYGIYEVQNSPWLKEINLANEEHSRHTSDLYKEFRHFICRFKDNTFEILAKTMVETDISTSELISLIHKEVGYLQENGG